MPKARPKIHFAALFGVAVDADLLHYWIPHYKALNLDSYSVFLHESKDPVLNAAVESRFIMEGFRVTMVPEGAVRNNPVCPGDPGIGVRSIIMEMVALSMDEKDYLITADADEFQQWTESPRATLERGVGVVLGDLIDCFDDTLHAPDPDKTLAENYPTEYFNLSSLWKEHPYNTKKICMSPARYPVDYSGSHEVKRHHHRVLPRVVVTGPIMVLHYRWRESALLRVMGRPNWPEQEIRFIKEFFGLELKNG